MGFRLSSSERRSLTRNGRHSQQPAPGLPSCPTPTASTTCTANRFSVHGTAVGELLIQAARQPEQQHSANRIYVGNILGGTSSDVLREFLLQIGIEGEDIQDVFQLKVRDPNKASFCISLGSVEAYNLIFKAEKWPMGVIVRPFKPQRSRRVPHSNNRPRTQVHSNASHNNRSLTHNDSVGSRDCNTGRRQNNNSNSLNSKSEYSLNKTGRHNRHTGRRNSHSSSHNNNSGSHYSSYRRNTGSHNSNSSGRIDNSTSHYINTSSHSSNIGRHKSRNTGSYYSTDRHRSYSQVVRSHQQDEDQYRSTCRSCRNGHGV